METDYKPAQQGQLDNFCGIYSLVNMVAFLHRKGLRRQAFKIHLVKVLGEEVKDIIDLVKVGIDDDEMDLLIEKGVMQGYYAQRYPVRITKPFEKGRWTTKRVKLAIERFLKEQHPEGSRIVLFGTQYHWSLIRAADGPYWQLVDSSGGIRVRKSSHSLIYNKTCYTIYRSAIYFCERGRSGGRQ